MQGQCSEGAHGGRKHGLPPSCRKSQESYICLYNGSSIYPESIESMSTWCQVVKRFKEECKCIEDSRFAVPVDLTKIKFLALNFLLSEPSLKTCIIGPYSFKSARPRSWTLPPLAPKGPSVGVLPLGFKMWFPGFSSVSLPAKVYHPSLFLWGRWSKHTSTVLSRSWAAQSWRQGSTLKHLYRAYPYQEYSSTSKASQVGMMQVSSTARKSVTVSWGKHNGLLASLGSQWQV